MYVYLRVRRTLRLKKYIKNKTLTKSYANVVNNA